MNNREMWTQLLHPFHIEKKKGWAAFKHYCWDVIFACAQTLLDKSSTCICIESCPCPGTFRYFYLYASSRIIKYTTCKTRETLQSHYRWCHILQGSRNCWRWWVVLDTANTPVTDWWTNVACDRNCCILFVSRGIRTLQLGFNVFACTQTLLNKGRTCMYIESYPKFGTFRYSCLYASSRMIKYITCKNLEILQRPLSMELYSAG